MAMPGQSGDLPVSYIKEAHKRSGPSKNDYDKAFGDLALFLFTRYKKKKQAEQGDIPPNDTGQIDHNVL